MASLKSLPRFTCRTQTHWLGRRSQSLSLLAASRCGFHGLAAFSPWPCPPPYLYGAQSRMKSLHMTPFFSAYLLISRVGGGDISAHRRGLTGSCSSTFQCYSLEAHLGLTASPHAPFPTGCVTPPVYSGSPPLGLTLFRSKERPDGPYRFLALSICIPIMLVSRRASPCQRREPGAR